MQEILVLAEIFLVFNCLFISTVSSAQSPGMLRVRESETREVKDLSGIWNFRADKSPDRMAGFRESWFLKPLSKVFYSYSVFDNLLAF